MNPLDMHPEEFGQWLRDLPQLTLVGVQVTSTNPAVLITQDPIWQFLCQTRNRAVDGILAGYQNGQYTDPPWVTTYRTAMAAAITAGALISAFVALTMFDQTFPTENANPEMRPLPG